jgi:tetratricopeptide (TPR) repeat protein
MAIMESTYDLFSRGRELLEAGDYHAAVVPLARARDRDPEPTSIREALGRAFFHTQRYEQARGEFEAIVERAPTNDYALFCLGRSLQKLGRHDEACRPLALAACLRPDRGDYRLYRDRARAAA